MKRIELDENTRAFVALCRAEALRLQTEFKTVNDLLNKQLAGIANKAGLKGPLKVSDDGTFLEEQEPPKPPEQALAVIPK